MTIDEWIGHFISLVYPEIMGAASRRSEYQKALQDGVDRLNLSSPGLEELAAFYYEGVYRFEEISLDNAFIEFIYDQTQPYLRYCWAWFLRLLRETGEVRFCLPWSIEMSFFISSIVKKLNLPGDAVYRDLSRAVKALFGDKLDEDEVSRYLPELTLPADQALRTAEVNSCVRLREHLARMQFCTLEARKTANTGLPNASAFSLTNKLQQPCITVGVYNFPDGIGDFHLLLKWGRYLRPLLDGKGYKLVSYLLLQSEEGEYYPWMLEHIAKLLHSHPFDLVYVDGTAAHQLAQYPIPETVVFNQEALVQDLNATKVFVDISFPTTVNNFYRHIPLHCRIIQNGECGVGSRLVKYINGILFHAGLPVSRAEVKTTLGLMLDPRPGLSLEEAAQSLLGLHDQHYLQCLLGNPSPTLEIAKHYLQTHRFMFGYAQNPAASLVFILVQMQLDDPRACDFQLPAKTLNPPILAKMFTRGFPAFNLQIINRETGDEIVRLDQSPSGKWVRIFSCQFLNEGDQQILYSISQDPGLCSGDNSFAEVVSSGRLPFIAPVNSSNQFAKFFIQQQWIPFLQANGFKALAHYFYSTTAHFYYLSSLGIARFKVILDTVNRIRQFLTPQLFEEWRICHLLLVEQYTLKNYIPPLLSAALREVAKNEQILRCSLHPPEGRPPSIFPLQPEGSSGASNNSNSPPKMDLE